MAESIVKRHYTRKNTLYDKVQVPLTTRDIRIDGEDEDGNPITVFDHKRCVFPKEWSDTACSIVASKYFREKDNKMECNIHELVDRVVLTIAKSGVDQVYFNSVDESMVFASELKHIILNQIASFNSPVWFNVGVEEKPQVSACFINSVDDSMESIMQLAVTEAMLFKHGSGTGTNLSTIRSSKEKVSGGGTASGPISFMKGYDAFAGVIRSGGKTRRSAKMVILNIDHPDIEKFIECKVIEEKKAWALLDKGYSGSFIDENGAYASVQYQNANNSVRVTDGFMNAVVRDGMWELKSVTTGEVIETVRARKIMEKICNAIYICGDPGIQFHDTVNNWHTCKEYGEIVASNPCAEYVFLDNSACNLASINLLKFWDKKKFDVESFEHVVSMMITAQDILVDMASYPTESIAENSHKFRPLGLGFANLGGLLMSARIPYESEEACAIAADIASLMTATAYSRSSVLAEKLGELDVDHNIIDVLEQHALSCSSKVKFDHYHNGFADVRKGALHHWKRLTEQDVDQFRNSQVTVIAPTGTIGYMMDCDSTGIEPLIALTYTKKTVDGGLITHLPNCVRSAISGSIHDGNISRNVDSVVGYITKHKSLPDGRDVPISDRDVFNCALPLKPGGPCISPQGHLNMLAAVQPFLSGAASKTINLPHDCSEKDIEEAIIETWRKGIKSVAFYRDGSKRLQPLNIEKEKKEVTKIEHVPVRRHMPDTRDSLTHKFSISGHKGYVTVGKYEDGTLGEIFIVMSKVGSFTSGLMDSFATVTSMALQYGVPLRTIVDKFSHARFEPSGFTTNPGIRFAKSVIDYIARWLGQSFLGDDKEDGDNQRAELNVDNGIMDDSPPCNICGTIMTRNGTCYRCGNCGNSSGCS